MSFFIFDKVDDELCHLVSSNMVIKPGMVDEPVPNHRGVSGTNKSGVLSFFPPAIPLHALF